MSIIETLGAHAWTVFPSIYIYTFLGITELHGNFLPILKDRICRLSSFNMSALNPTPCRRSFLVYPIETVLMAFF